MLTDALRFLGVKEIVNQRRAQWLPPMPIKNALTCPALQEAFGDKLQSLLPLLRDHLEPKVAGDGDDVTIEGLFFVMAGSLDSRSDDIPAIGPGENGGSDYILEEGGSLPLYKSVGKTEMWVIPKVSFEGFLMEHADKAAHDGGESPKTKTVKVAQVKIGRAHDHHDDDDDFGHSNHKQHATNALDSEILHMANKKEAERIARLREHEMKEAKLPKAKTVVWEDDIIFDDDEIDWSNDMKSAAKKPKKKVTGPANPQKFAAGFVAPGFAEKELDGMPSRQKSHYNSDGMPPRQKTKVHDNDGMPPRQKTKVHDNDGMPPRQKTKVHDNDGMPARQKTRVHDDKAKDKGKNT
jgi:hypothetical protein